MNFNPVLPHGAAYAAELRKEADNARLLAEVYATEADLEDLDRRLAANALRAFARRIARLVGWREPTATDVGNRRPARPTRPARTTA